jgi:hypothetical protein
MLISKPLKVAKKFIQNMFNKSPDAVHLNNAQPNLSLVLIFMLGFQIDMYSKTENLSVSYRHLHSTGQML